MDLEEEAMPYLKLLNENSGSYLIQNSYELQDCLSVEPMFTEIETETWPSECFPVLLNDGNMKCIPDHVITEKVQASTERKNSNGHVILSQPVNSEDSYIYQKNKIPISSDTTRNILVPQNSILRVNSRSLNESEESQQGKQKRTILLMANGNSYELSYSNKSVDSAEMYVDEKSILSEDLNESSADITHRINKDEEVEEQDETASNSEYPKDQDYDYLSDWNEFYSIVTAIKCKVCSFLCESSVEMTDHLKSLHGELLQLKQIAEKEDTDGKQRVKMKSLLNSNSTPENNVTIFLCSMCNDIFSTRESLMEHVKIHNQGSDFSEVTIDDENLNESTDPQKKQKQSMRNLSTSLLRKQQKALNKIKCSVKGCTLKFSNNESKYQHEACHMPDMKQFQCPQCEEKFSHWRICSKHLWTCHKVDAGLYTCPICNNYKSNSRVAVINHMDIHNSEKPFICTECFKGFKQLNQLRNHRLIHKSEEDLPPGSTTNNCTICNRLFANSKSLKKHIQSVHDKIKPFSCNICGHKAARKAMLELHMRQHTGDKPHLCPNCTYRTADHNCLRKHVMKHYGFMKYSCPYCKYRAIQSSAYKNHLTSKHPEAKEIFKCDKCTFTSLRFDSYLTHVKCHEYDKAKIEKELAENSAVDINTTGSRNQVRGETQVYLHLSEDSDYLEDIEDTGGITIPAIGEILLSTNNDINKMN